MWGGFLSLQSKKGDPSFMGQGSRMQGVQSDDSTGKQWFFSLCYVIN